MNLSVERRSRTRKVAKTEQNALRNGLFSRTSSHSSCLSVVREVEEVQQVGLDALGCQVGVREGVSVEAVAEDFRRGVVGC